MSQSNADLIRTGYESFAAGDVPAVLALFDDRIAWTVSGRSPLAGSYSGPDEVLGFFQSLGERSGGTFDLHVHDCLDNGRDTVVVLLTETAQRDGKSLETAAVHVWSVENGKATTFQAFIADQYVADEFWS